MSTLLITGGTSGLGKALVEKFVSHGWHAVVLARDTAKGAALQEQLGTNNITFYPCDIRDKATLTNVFAQIKQIDCFINNTGIGYWENAADESLEHIEDTIQTNLISAMRCTKLGLQIMVPQKSGVLINIGSTRSTSFRTGASAYAASKAGLKMYTDVMREEVREHNIKVISIYPGAIKTPMRDKEEVEKFGDKMLEPSSIANIIFDAYTTALTGVVQEDIFIRPVCGNL